VAVPRYLAMQFLESESFIFRHPQQKKQGALWIVAGYKKNAVTKF
jgi:hypothetical protein